MSFLRLQGSVIIKKKIDSRWRDRLHFVTFQRTNFIAGMLAIDSAVAIDNLKLIPRYSQWRTVLKIGGVRLPEEGRDKNQPRFWSDATTSRSHVRHGHITANVLSANRARINPKLSADFSRGDPNFCGRTILGQFTAARGAQKRGTCWRKNKRIDATRCLRFHRIKKLWPSVGRRKLKK